MQVVLRLKTVYDVLGRLGSIRRVMIRPMAVDFNCSEMECCTT